jgi:hypothetical protein
MWAGVDGEKAKTTEQARLARDNKARDSTARETVSLGARFCRANTANVTSGLAGPLHDSIPSSPFGRFRARY